MKLCLLSLILTLGLSACSGSTSDKKEPFDEAKWRVSEGDDYPYRGEMLHDLVYNYEWHGLSKEAVIERLGPPDKSKDGHLYYNISRNEVGIITLHTTTLVIKLDADSTVVWRKIHE